LAVRSGHTVHSYSNRVTGRVALAQAVSASHPHNSRRRRVPRPAGAAGLGARLVEKFEFCVTYITLERQAHNL
jgi:hypothetical protein